MFLTLSTNSVVDVSTASWDISSVLSDTAINGNTNISIAAKNIAMIVIKESPIFISFLTFYIALLFIKF